MQQAARPAQATGSEARTRRRPRPTLAVYKFASCDGCQLSLLDCEDELLELAEVIDIANFAEASRDMRPGPYDVTLVEGSVTTAHDARRLLDVRRDSRFLVTIGACATAGGIQALRNLGDVKAYTTLVYAQPQYIETLATSTPISAHVKVDFELRGCPVNKAQLIEVVSALLAGRRPRTPAHAVCVECKQSGIPCVMVSHGTPCMGPVTHAGCGALCPSYARGCFGCFGPQDTPNTAALSAAWKGLGVAPEAVRRAYHAYHVGSPAFLAAGHAADPSGQLPLTATPSTTTSAGAANQER